MCVVFVVKAQPSNTWKCDLVLCYACCESSALLTPASAIWCPAVFVVKARPSNPCEYDLVLCYACCESSAILTPVSVIWCPAVFVIIYLTV